MLFKYYMKGLKRLKKLNEFETYEGIIYRLIALKAIKDTQKAFKKFMQLKLFDEREEFYIKSAWDELNLKEAISPYAPFSSNKKL